MSKASYFLQLRGRQLLRSFQEVGWVYLLLVIPIAGIFVLILLEFLQSTNLPIGSALFYPMIVFFIQRSRKDLVFIEKIPISKTLLFGLEYNLLLLPLSILLLIVNKFELAILGHLLVSTLVMFFPLQKPSRSRLPLNWFIPILSILLFEWRGTIRRYHFLFIGLYLMGCVLALHYFVYQLFALIMAGLIAATFKDLENKEILLQQPSIERKWMYNSLFISVLLVPHGMIFLWKSPDVPLVLLGIYAYLILFQTYCLCYKYAHYSPFKRTTNNGLATGFFMILAPIFPVSIPITIYYYWQAKKSLKRYRN